MKRNKSVYLTKWEKQIITVMIKKHLENIKTNIFFGYAEDTFKKIINKLDVKKETNVI